MIANRIANRLRLFKDLLEHEVGISPALSRFRVPGDPGCRAMYFTALECPNRVSVTLENRDLAVIEYNHLPSAPHNSRNVRRHESLAIVLTQHHRCAAAPHGA